jgi:hypothetical protein
MKRCGLVSSNWETPLDCASHRGGATKHNDSVEVNEITDPGIPRFMSTVTERQIVVGDASAVVGVLANSNAANL